MNKTNTIWYVFHEFLSESRGNRALLKAKDSLQNCDFVDAYAEFTGFKIDVAKEQARLVAADLVIFQHPFYWYSSPALFKEWQDKVLTFGFAYPPKHGTALHGKAWLSVITTGGPEWSYKSGGYNNFSMSELLRPLQQTAYLCGMRWLPPYIVHGVLPGDYEEIKATKDSALHEAATGLEKYLTELDLQKVRSIEPVSAPHYLNAKKLR